MTQSPLLQSLFDDEERRPLSVSEIIEQVRGALEQRFANVWVEGEIADFKRHSSGHWYFTLRDGSAQIRAACYQGTNWKIRFRPFNGLQVRVRGKITVYDKTGDYQITVESLKPVGEGALKIAFEQIRSKLETEGLLAEEIKRQLPKFPRRVAVVTSRDGAAFYDIRHVLTRRARSVSILLVPTIVQGEKAAEKIRRAIVGINKYNDGCDAKNKIDVLIVSRGGGSAEDLWAFNEEHLARAIRASAIPVISAVGHEIDVTIADLVADLRAPTPSAAAELVAAREEDICNYIQARAEDMRRSIDFKMLSCSTELQSLSMSPVFIEFPNSIKDRQHEIDDSIYRMQTAVSDRIGMSLRRVEQVSTQLSPLQLASKVSANTARLAVLSQRNEAAVKNAVGSRQKIVSEKMASLDALSPLSVLGRGFSITQKEDGTIVRDSMQAKINEQVKIRLAKGSIKAKVVECGAEARA